MLNNKIDDFLKNGRNVVHAARALMANRFARRPRQVVAVATLAGIALIGFVAAALTTSQQPKTSNTSAETHRDQAAQQGNRSARDSATPTESPKTESPETVASPTEVPEAPKTEPPPSPKPKKPNWVLPMRAEVSSCFGPRWGTMHQGIDFAGDANTPIRAVGAGKVVAAGWVYSGYGISVVVDHGNGYLTHYAHMNETAVGLGSQVKPGDTLGYEGSTGDSTGPHLHFEVHAGMWNQIDPAPWMRARGAPIAGC